MLVFYIFCKISELFTKLGDYRYKKLCIYQAILRVIFLFVLPYILRQHNCQERDYWTISNGRIWLFLHSQQSKERKNGKTLQRHTLRYHGPNKRTIFGRLWNVWIWQVFGGCKKELVILVGFILLIKMCQSCLLILHWGHEKVLMWAQKITFFYMDNFFRLRNKSNGQISLICFLFLTRNIPDLVCTIPCWITFIYTMFNHDNYHLKRLYFGNWVPVARV